TADTATLTSVTIPSGSSTASFLYKDTVAGSPTIAADDQAPPTGTDTGLARATQTETVNAANAFKFVFTTSPQTLTAGVNSGTVTVQLQDAFSNPVNATGPGQTLNLAPSPYATLFRSTADTLTVTSVTIPSGS